MIHIERMSSEGQLRQQVWSIDHQLSLGRLACRRKPGFSPCEMLRGPHSRTAAGRYRAVRRGGQTGRVAALAQLVAADRSRPAPGRGRVPPAASVRTICCSVSMSSGGAARLMSMGRKCLPTEHVSCESISRSNHPGTAGRHWRSGAIDAVNEARRSRGQQAGRQQAGRQQEPFCQIPRSWRKFPVSLRREFRRNCLI
jgi:hypothetical protein